MTEGNGTEDAGERGAPPSREPSGAGCFWFLIGLAVAGAELAILFHFEDGPFAGPESTGGVCVLAATLLAGGWLRPAFALGFLVVIGLLVLLIFSLSGAVMV